MEFTALLFKAENVLEAELLSVSVGALTITSQGQIIQWVTG